MQNCGMALPLCTVSWAESLRTQTVCEDLCFWPAPKFGPKTGLNLSKTGLNLSEDLFFFFGLHLILDRKTGLILAAKILILIFVYSQIF